MSDMHEDTLLSGSAAFAVSAILQGIGVAIAVLLILLILIIWRRRNRRKNRGNSVYLFH